MIGVNKNNYNRAGFTLMEMVVALAIFSIATTYSVSIFVQSNTVQKKTANIQKLTADARYALEVMARETRLGTIDYSYAGYNLPLTAPQAELAILDADNNPVRFRKIDAGNGRFVAQVCSGADCLTDTYTDITPSDLSVEKLAFYISPSRDPFLWQATGYSNNLQPRVTIVLETRDLGVSLAEQALTNLQTTVVERKYVR